jgi:hypothetical protein
MHRWIRIPLITVDIITADLPLAPCLLPLLLVDRLHPSLVADPDLTLKRQVPVDGADVLKLVRPAGVGMHELVLTIIMDDTRWIPSPRPPQCSKVMWPFSRLTQHVKRRMISRPR